MYTTNISHETSELLTFIDKCNTLYYKNNNSLKSMKFHWCLDNGGAWYATYDNNNEIISISGIHPFMDGYRALFRGVQFYSRDIGLSKHHMQSHCFYSQLPYQINFANNLPIYITTNVENDASGKMIRIDKTFHHLHRVGLVDHVSQENIFNTLQNVWKLNVEKYSAVRF